MHGDLMKVAIWTLVQTAGSVSLIAFGHIPILPGLGLFTFTLFSTILGCAWMDAD